MSSAQPGSRPAGSDSPVAVLTTRLVLLVAVVVGTGVLLGTLFLPTAVAAADLIDTVRTDVLDVGPLSEAEPVAQNSYVYAADGSVIAELNAGENREPVELADIPDVVVNAVIATEDAAFREHDGVNYGAMVRAAIANVRAGGIEQGGSTITQQYVERAYLGSAVTFEKKITEAIWAIELERRLSKDQILERYLNHAYFGSGAYGIGTAAERYFGRPISEIELPEAAMLAGLLRAPEINDPIDNPGNARERRDIVLDQMAGQGFVTRDQAAAAKSTKLEIDPKAPAPPDNPFWVSWVQRLLTSESVAEGFGNQLDAYNAVGATQEDRVDRVFKGGLRIHTTLDPELQKLGEATIREHLTYDDEPPEEVAQEPFGGIVSVEPGSGAIRSAALGPRAFGTCSEEGTSYVGVNDEGRLLCDKTKIYPLMPNMGSRYGRQPGSAFKPFVTTTALENGIPPGWTTNATGPQVIEGCDDDGDTYEVRNAGGDGRHNLYTGLEKSSNVFHAKLIAEVGPANVADLAERIGIFSSDVPEFCSIALGSADIFPVEMATAYATLANRGEYCKPFAITRIEDASGQPIYEHEPECERVLDEEVVDRVVDIMAGPVGPGGTAPIADLGQWPTRGKTGTTQDYRDAWFVGYVKQLATAAWVGYPNGGSVFESLEAARAACDTLFQDAEGEDLPQCQESTKFLENVTIAGQYHSRVFGSTIPAPMWKDYMSQAVQRFEPKSFPDPGPLPKTTVPDLVGADSISEAETIAEEARLRLVVETVEHYRPEGTFIGQDPAAGERVIAGAAVTLEVSDGTGEVPRVPDVVGMQRDEAVDVLESAGYGVEVVRTRTDKRKDDGRVLDQSPEGGKRAAPDDDTTVTIEVGRFEPDDEDSETENGRPGSESPDPER